MPRVYELVVNHSVQQGLLPLMAGRFHAEIFCATKRAIFTVINGFLNGFRFTGFQNVVFLHFFNVNSIDCFNIKPLKCCIVAQCTGCVLCGTAPLLIVHPSAGCGVEYRAEPWL